MPEELKLPLSHDKIYHRDSNHPLGLKMIDGKFFLDPFCESEDPILFSRFWSTIRDYYHLNKEEVLNILNIDSKSISLNLIHYDKTHPLGILEKGFGKSKYYLDPFSRAKFWIHRESFYNYLKCVYNIYDPDEVLISSPSSDIVYHKNLKTPTGLSSRGSGRSLSYLNPFVRSNQWINCNQFPVLMKDCYDLSLTQVWNIIHKLDKNYIHTCEYCGGPIEISTMYLGIPRYCCHSCILEARWEDPEFRNKKIEEMLVNWNDPEFRDKVANSIRECWEDPEFRSVHSERLRRLAMNPYIRALSDRSNFINRAKSNTGYFYITLLRDSDNIIKFGITSYENPCEYFYVQSYRGYLSPKILVKGSIEYISELEFLIKTKMLKGEYIDYKDWKDFKKYFRESIIELNYGNN